MEDKHTTVVEAEIVKPILVPKFAKYFFGAVAYIWAFIITISQIKAFAEIFKESLAIGLLILLSGIGAALIMLPAIIAWGGPTYLVEWAENARTKARMWGRLFIGYIGVIALPQIVSILIGLLVTYMLY